MVLMLPDGFPQILALARLFVLWLFCYIGGHESDNGRITVVPSRGLLRLRHILTSSIISRKYIETGRQLLSQLVF